MVILLIRAVLCFYSITCSYAQRPSLKQRKGEKMMYMRGSSSVVELHLAKVDVAGSNPVSRFYIYQSDLEAILRSFFILKPISI
jgi:hypothetical protein